MGQQRQLSPEFDLPPLIYEVLKGYIGTRRFNKLTTHQRQLMVDAVSGLSGSLGVILENENPTHEQ